MAIKYECDMCGIAVPIESGLKQLSLGGVVIAELCLTCGSKIEQTIKQQIADRLAGKVLDEQQQAADELNRLKDAARPPATGTSDALTPPAPPRGT